MIETSEHDRAQYGTHVVLDDSDHDDCMLCGEIIGSPPNMDRHLESCPYKTGVWTMEDPIHQFFCEGCGEEHSVQYACPRCNMFFEEDDPYRLIDDATGLLVLWVEAPANSTAICVDCAQKQTDALMERLS